MLVQRVSKSVSYFYHNPRMPLFLLTAYAKNQRSDLSQAERNDFRHLTLLLVNSFGRNNR